jgi:DNA-binding MarR family transcriptional regulator
MAIAVWHLYRSERVTAGDLARQCGCDAGNLSSLLDRLEESGLVERVSCENDRRVRYVALTAKGRKIGSQVQSDYKRSGVYNELNRLAPREREAFTNILLRITAAIHR